MRTDTRNRISGLLSLLVLVAASAVVASPAFASTGCAEPAQPAEVSDSSTEVSLDSAISPTNAASACVTTELDAVYELDPDGSGEPGCGSCPSVIASVAAEGDVAAEIHDPVTEQDAPLVATHVSDETQTCLTAGRETGTVCPQSDSTSSSGSAEVPRERSVSLQASTDEAAANDSVQFLGAIDAEDGCFGGQPLQLVAKRPGEAGFRILRIGTSGDDGTFDFQVVVGTAREFRVLAPANDGCYEAVSEIVTLRSRR